MTVGRIDSGEIFMTAHLEQTRVSEFHAFALSNHAMRVVVVPEVGGKIVSLQSRAGREWLWQNPHIPLRRPPSDAADFGQYDCGGWDEIFPTVTPCRIPHSPWGDRLLTDHGELWYRPWTVLAAQCSAEHGVSLSLAVDSTDLPFRFLRTLTLGNGVSPLIITYILERRCNAPLPYLWAAHPIFSINPKDRIILPSGIPVNSTGSLGIELDSDAIPFPWPHARLGDGTFVDLSCVPQRTAGTAIKLFAANHRNDCVELEDGSCRERLRIAFNPTNVTHVGLWLNYGAWSGAGGEPYFNAGIEPTTCGRDSLAEGVAKNDCHVMDSAARTWSISVSVESPQLNS